MPSEETENSLRAALEYWQRIKRDIEDREGSLWEMVHSIDRSDNSNAARGLEAWAYNHWNKSVASFREFDSAVDSIRFGMGRISTQLGFDTRVHPDVTVYSPATTMAVEIKNITTNEQGAVDTSLRSALEQLSRRDVETDGREYRSWQAHITITSEHNPWPYTPTGLPNSRPCPYDLGEQAKQRGISPGTDRRRTAWVKVRSAVWGEFQFPVTI